MVEENYRDSSAVNQSRLKLLLGNEPNLFLTSKEPDLYYEEKDYFIIGNLVDCMLTTPNEFDNKFHVSNIVKPSDKLMSMVNYIYDKVKQDLPDVFKTIKLTGAHATDNAIRSYVLESLEEHKYYPSWGETTRINKIIECQSYWDELVIAEDKQVVTVEEKEKADLIVMSIKSAECSAHYFRPNTKDVENYYQVPLYFTYEDVDCKALLDIIQVDHRSKTIYIVDVKTMWDNPLNFSKSVLKRRYDIQISFYYEGLLRDTSTIFYELISQGYRIACRFIVESSNKPGNPINYVVSYETITLGRVGQEAIFSPEGVRLKDEIVGFKKLIEDYKFYEANGFDKHIFYYNNNGNMNLVL